MGSIMGANSWAGQFSDAFFSTVCCANRDRSGNAPRRFSEDGRKVAISTAKPDEMSPAHVHRQSTDGTEGEEYDGALPAARGADFTNAATINELQEIYQKSKTEREEFRASRRRRASSFCSSSEGSE